MYGGTLFSSSVIILEEHNLLLAAFANSYYTFSLTEGTLQAKYTYHHHPIRGLYLNHNQKAVVSVDKTGLAVETTINAQGCLEGKGKSWYLVEGEVILEVKVLEGEGEQVQFFCLTESGKIFRYSDSNSLLITSQSAKILYLSSQYLIIRDQDNKVRVISSVTLQPLFQYSHSAQVTAAEVYQKSLLLGDAAGKISLLNGFLQGGEVRLKQKLQWHVHEVTALRVEGSYLYSSGEEGVVVVWHLRQNKRDFLPRFGNKILNFFVGEGKVICILADNTIKCVLLGQDKALIHYKAIVGTKFDNLNQVSSQKVKNSLIRLPALEDRLFMRSTPGKIQELNLGSGLNKEHSIVNRNVISRLDNSFPCPHQITDLCLSKDGSKLVVAVEGLNLRSLRFYQQGGDGYQLVSKVQNVHEGCQSIRLVQLGDKFISYSVGDKVLKVWKLMQRRKESILQVEQSFWGCDYEMVFRSKRPVWVGVWEQKVTVAFKNQFVVFNTADRTVEGVYQTESDKEITAIYQLKSHSSQRNLFLAVFKTTVELLEFCKQGCTATVVLQLSPEFAIQSHNLNFNSKYQALSLLVQATDKQSVYIYQVGNEVQHFEIDTNDQSYLTDLFWLGERLLAFTSELLFYDLTHGKELVTLDAHTSQVVQRKEEMLEEEEEESALTGDFDSLRTRYLMRQFKKDQGVLEKAGEVLGVAPSMGASWSYLAGQLWL